MEVRLTVSAARDLDSIAEYIAEEDADAAAKAVLRVLDAVEPLAQLPNLGRPGRVPGTRELVINRSPFIAIYRVRANVLWVIRVLHTSRRWPTRP